MQSTRKISLFTAITVALNAMTGVGIFTTPATLYNSTGPAGILTFIFAIIAVLCMALAIARVAQLYPGEGSFYTYTASWAGHKGGLFSAGLYIIGLTIALGLITRVTGSFLHTYFPSMPAHLLGSITLIMLVLLNIAGARISTIGQYILLALTLLPFASIIVLCATTFNPAYLSPFMPYGPSSLFKAIGPVIFGFFGFESVMSLYKIVDRPEINVPRAVIASILIVGLLYLTFISALFMGIPGSAFSSASTPLTQTLITAFPHHGWIIPLINISMIITFMGVIHSMVWALGTLCMSLLQKIYPSSPYARPTLILPLLGGAILSCSYAFTNIQLFFDLTTVFIVMSFILTIATLLIGKREQSKFYKTIACCGLATALIIISYAIQQIIHAS